MELMLEPVIEGHPYPKLYGGYRCCVNGEWYDCDKHGNITGQALQSEVKWDG